MSYHRFSVGLMAAVLLLIVAFASYAPAGSTQPFSVRPTWLNISTFNFHANTRMNSKDSFVLKGSFNAVPQSIDPTIDDVTLTIGERPFSYTHDLWKQVGKSNKYMAKIDGVSAQIEYWVGSSSRCSFTFIGSRQDLPSYIISPDETRIELQIGVAFDETVGTEMIVHNVGPVYNVRMDSYLELAGPTFALDSLRIARNTRKTGHDSMTMKARCWDEGFDPSANDIYVGLGSFQATIPAGTMTVAKGTARGKLSFVTGGKVSISINLNTGKATLVFTNVDLSSLQNPDDLFVQVIGTAPASWNFHLTFKENKNHTSFAY
jgi:hypothetical protein